MGAAAARRGAVDVKRGAANSRRMISFDQALAIVRAAAHPLGTQTVPIEEAAGRVVAKPVVAAIDSPRADVSAMDGYAVRTADLPGKLAVVGESLPGTGWAGVVEGGICVRIFTGAPLPSGADRIVVQELVIRDGDVAVIGSQPDGATWVRPRGADFRRGDELLPVGRRLDPTALVAATGADLAEVEAFVQPRLALFATGDELTAPGLARQSALGVPDSVLPGLSALAGQWGAMVVHQRRLRDDLNSMRAAASDAAGLADVIVVTGGASVGERDFAKAMFEPLGLELLFSKVAIRPGKPAWFGRVGGKLVLGLPGNPTSALVTARLLLAPLLSALQGQNLDESLCWEPARLGSPLPPCDARETFHRAVLIEGQASILPYQESHAQKTLALANVLIRQAASSPASAPGTIVQVLRL
jgi:molybdopterin molybdotransferase